MTVSDFINRLQELIKKGYGDYDIFVGYSLQWKKIFNVYRNKSFKKVIIDSVSLEDDYKTFTLSEFIECFLKENFDNDYLLYTRDNKKVIDIDIDIDKSVTIGIEE